MEGKGLSFISKKGLFYQCLERNYQLKKKNTFSRRGKASSQETFLRTYKNKSCDYGYHMSPRVVVIVF